MELTIKLDEICKNCIANEIRQHFDRNYVACALLFGIPCENSTTIKISKKQLNHILRLHNVCETQIDYDFEIVDEIDLTGRKELLIP